MRVHTSSTVVHTRGTNHETGCTCTTDSQSLQTDGSAARKRATPSLTARWHNRSRQECSRESPVHVYGVPKAADAWLGPRCNGHT